ncbi:Creatinine amidohydrolase [Planctomycetes bacterium K23_9]|uniref:Creatinine amidohydrolase n=2 Tax=Stieleria marina TaxID=1930275 RepID=A0A517NSD4_9BACT|nr:Creatinine amidohydrolase [Planctomycetes bacterium K23_9]
MTQSKRRPWLLAENNYADLRDADIEVAVIPLGATEPHNLHLPYGTDVYEATELATRIGEQSYTAGAKVRVLPTIPFGVQTNMRKLPLAINVNPATLDLFLTDVVHSLIGSNVKKILLFNSHGGNDFKPLLRTLAGQDIQLFLCDWFRLVNDVYDSIFDHPEDHAGEMETSFMLAHFPHLVAQNADGTLTADDGDVRANRFEAINKGWIQITRQWDLLTTNCGSGNPHQSTVEKGHQVTKVVVDRVADFIVDLSDSELDAEFPF